MRLLTVLPQKTHMLPNPRPSQPPLATIALRVASSGTLRASNPDEATARLAAVIRAFHLDCPPFFSHIAAACRAAADAQGAGAVSTSAAGEHGPEKGPTPPWKRGGDAAGNASSLRALSASTLTSILAAAVCTQWSSKQQSLELVDLFEGVSWQLVHALRGDGQTFRSCDLVDLFVSHDRAKVRRAFGVFGRLSCVLISKQIQILQ